VPGPPTPLPLSLPRDPRLAGLVLAGVVAGWLLSPKGQAWLGASANAGLVTALMIAGGGLAGAVLYLLYVQWQGPGALWRVDSAKVRLPVLGEVTLTVRRRSGYTTKPSHGMPWLTGTACALPSWAVRRRRASRATMHSRHSSRRDFESSSSTKSST